MASLLRCKFRVSTIAAAKNADGTVGQERITLMAVRDPENELWSKATPAGTLDLTITNPAAFGKLAPEQEIYIDLVPVEE